jgi:hypothetical protein
MTTSHYTPYPTQVQVRVFAVEHRKSLLEKTKSKKHLLFLMNDIESLLNIQK